MSNELVISSTPDGERIALLQDKRLIEYHIETTSNQFTVGDIYLGIVRKVNPGLNAAFVDIGHEKDAFLHYLDMGPQVKSLNKYVKLAQTSKMETSRLNGFPVEPDIDKMGKMTTVLTKGQQILVQVVKEPISTKGPRLSCEISLAGRFIILVPFSNTVSISKKIVSKEERHRLVRLITSIKPENFGIIIRTVAEHKEVAELDKDLTQLLQKWEAGFNLLKQAKPKDKVIGEMSRASSILRDMLNESFDSIAVDSKEMYEEVKRYVKSFAPEKEKIIKLHSGKNKLFEVAGIEKQLKSLFGKTVSLPGGGYLVIEHTEALHVIDVNSGSSSNRSIEGNDQEATAMVVNSEAAKEIARQLRLRDMGGIIVVDFIDQKKPENKKLLFDKMRDEMQTERARHTVLPLSKFGIMQITRQRVRPEMNITTMEICPNCNGSGKISPTIVVTDQLEANLDFLLTKQNEKGISISVHPFLFAYYAKGFPSRQFKWLLKYKSWVNLREDSSLGLTEYRFTGKSGEAIELN